MAETQKTREHRTFPDMLRKSASLSTQEVTPEELKAINRYALEPLTADEVFTFKAVLCDNELDRDHEQFTQKALRDMQKMFLGRTVIKNHSWNADDQVARIYATELVQGEKSIANGELYTQLVARCYMVKTASNADLIAEIKGGIKKEGSVGFAASSCICSICGTDNAKSYCRHYPGRSYENEGGSQVCTFSLAGVRDAYEFSLVAVPAQRAAGVSKSYTGQIVFESDQPEDPGTEPQTASDGEAKKTLDLRVRIGAARAKLNAERRKNNE
ncbi:MAG: hypothetical protein J6L72_08695 [Butyricicoccus sp.]|nr:hypothetical protein [Butyricicoccus sp.]